MKNYVRSEFKDTFMRQDSYYREDSPSRLEWGIECGRGEEKKKCCEEIKKIQQVYLILLPLRGKVVGRGMKEEGEKDRG